MTQAEIETIENVIRKLKGGRDGSEVTSSDAVTAMLNSDAMRIWLDTWIIGALELLPPGPNRDPMLARRLSR